MIQNPNIPPDTKAKKAQHYAEVIQGTEKFLGVGKGCLLLWMMVASIEDLEALQERSTSGALTDVFQQAIVTEAWLQKLNLTSIKIKVAMRHADYLQARQRLQTGMLC